MDQGRADAGGGLTQGGWKGRSLRSGRVVAQTTDRTFMYPTKAAFARGRLLVVNSQFDRRSAQADSELPFTVSTIRRP